MGIDLALLAGSAMGSYKDTRRQLQEEKEREWYRKHQEEIQALNKMIQEKTQSRLDELHPLEVARMAEENRGLMLGNAFTEETNPIKKLLMESELNMSRLGEEGAGWQNKLLGQKHDQGEQLFPTQLNLARLEEKGAGLQNLLLGQKHQQGEEMFPFQREEAEMGNKLLGQKYQQGEQMFPFQLNEAAMGNQLLGEKLLAAAQESRESEEEYPEIGIPSGDAQKSKMWLDLYNYLDEYDVGSQYLEDIQKHEAVLTELLGEPRYEALLFRAMKHGLDKKGKETYFGRNYKPGERENSPITAYLKYLRLIP